MIQSLSEEELEEGLPHLFAYDWYTWAHEFFVGRDKEMFLCAANQVSKSSTNIRKCIHWATDKKLWPELWPHMPRPNQFWYWYPDFETATIEFETKWQEFLPRGWAKNDPTYGWKEHKEKGKIQKIIFNSGVTIYFKAYSQKLTNVQASTVFAMFADEEMPILFLGEIQARLNATDGYFHMVFTATIGQEHWRRCLEEKGSDLETHVGAWKRSVSLYDCMYYANGKPSHWTKEKIERAKKRCATQSEVLKRIYGRFVLTGGLEYEAFDTDRNRCEPHDIPDTWSKYSGVDIGSGGEAGHPAAIAMVAVDPTYSQGRVYLGWRGDGISTTAADILDKYEELAVKQVFHLEQYDWQSKDFFEIACRRGKNFTPADKGREKGVQMLNTLFKSGMLKIFSGDGELDKLVVELCSLKKGTQKTKAIDDFCDALRYAVAKIPWDWSVLDRELESMSQILEKNREKPKEKSSSQLRREYYMGLDDKGGDQIEDELREWNEHYGQ